MAVEVSRDEVVAFRLRSHHLHERSEDDGLIDAAGRCAVQNSPPGSALLALSARVRDISQDRLDEAVAEEKSLLQTWCMRGAPFYFPTLDAPVFTTGVLPPTETARRHLVPGVEPALEQLDMTLDEAVDLVGAEISDVLAGRLLAIDELGSELAGRITPQLSDRQRTTWQEEGPYAAGQPLGEGVVHFCIRILTLQRLVCFAPRAGNKAPFVLVDEWLDEPIPDVDPEVARAELLRRYLRSYGPSTRADFAAWVGVRTGDSDAWWRPVQGELSEVDFGGASWVLTDDLDALRSATAPTGVRLLPPRDPYTQLRDRATIVDEAHHREVWRAQGGPGTVLIDGEIAGTWRPRKRGQRLTITVEPFAPLSARDRERLEDEAERIGPLRGASSVDVGYGSQ